MKDRYPAKVADVCRTQAPGHYFHNVDDVSELQPQIKVTGRDAKVTRIDKMSDGNTRNTKKLVMEAKGVQGTFGTGPAYFRSGVLNGLRGFKQAKTVDGECGKEHRIGSDPTPRQMREPSWQRWKPREDV